MEEEEEEAALSCLLSVAAGDGDGLVGGARRSFWKLHHRAGCPALRLTRLHLLHLQDHPPEHLHRCLHTPEEGESVRELTYTGLTWPSGSVLLLSFTTSAIRLLTLANRRREAESVSSQLKGEGSGSLVTFLCSEQKSS